uniref:Replication protein A OB domain-containing protein n=1 Tax=Oryza glumipatula TaxID=40148 RepID=A0A0E0ANB7_9ORYZ
MGRSIGNPGAIHGEINRPLPILLASRNATKLKQINLGQQNLKVFGLLIRLWDAKNMASASTPTIFSIDGVILDEEFKSSTKVHHLESRGSSIPNYGFEFCPFDQIPSKSGISKPLIDLIGVISHVGPYDYAGKTSSKKNRKLKIRNKDEQEQEIVLWGEYGESFDEAFVLQKSTDHKIVVAILAGLTAGTYLGKTEATSSSATQIYFDSDITEIAEYQSSYQWDIPTLQQQMPRVEHLTPLQAADESGTLDAVAFYNVAEDLVEVNATQATQNLKIDATEHAIALDTAIGKTRLFHIAMNTKYSSHFTINYVLKSYPVENENTSLMLPTLENTKVAKVQLIHTNYLQAVSKITASKSTAISITLQGKSSTDDLSKLQPTQAHVVNYMKNKLPHMHIILDGENVKNNEI